MKKKSGNFKFLFQKIHQDNLLRSRFINQPMNSIALIGTQKSFVNIEFHKKIGKSKKKLMYEQKMNDQNYRPKSARPISSKIYMPLQKQLNSESVKNFNENANKFQNQMIRMLNRIPKQQITLFNQQFKVLKNLCIKMKTFYYDSLSLLQQFSDNLSSTMHQQGPRIFFYFVYSKFLQCSNSNKQASIMNKQLQQMMLCDQYSRVLQLYEITMYSCARIQKILFYLNQHQKSKNFALKYLRLAIFMKDQTQQFKAVEALKILNFHCGSISNCQHQVQQQDRVKILKNYHPSQDLQNSPEGQNQINRTDFSLNIQQSNHQIDIRISRNRQKFVSNLTLMNKDLSQRSKSIKKTIQKVNRVGTLKKYIAHDNYITLQPRSRNLPNQHREQVILTHSRKKSQLDSNIKFQRFYLPKIIEAIEFIIAQCSHVSIISDENKQN